MNKTSLRHFLEFKGYPKTEVIMGKPLHASDIQFANLMLDYLDTPFVGRKSYARKVLIQDSISPKHFTEIDKECANSYLIEFHDDIPMTQKISKFDFRKVHLAEFKLLLYRFSNIVVTISHIFDCLGDIPHIPHYYSKADFYMCDLQNIETLLKDICAKILLTKYPTTKILLRAQHCTPSFSNDSGIRNLEILNTDIQLNTTQLSSDSLHVNLNASKIDIVHKDVMDNLKILSSETTSHINK